MKILVLWEEGFPFVDTCSLTQESLTGLAKSGDTLQFSGAASLAEALDPATTIFVTPYGSAFPKEAWSAIYDFLDKGGRWLNIGGSPLSRPVRRNRDGSWFVEASQTSFTKQLLINQAFPVNHGYVENKGAGAWMGGIMSYEYYDDDGEVLDVEYGAPNLDYHKSWTLQPRFTDTRDFNHEHGTGGSRDAKIETLLYGMRGRRAIAAPIVCIDRLLGRFAGGRWVLVNAELNSAPEPELLKMLVEHTALGAVDMEPRPTFATFYEGEQPSLTLRLKGGHTTGAGTVAATVREADGRFIGKSEVSVTLGEYATHARISLNGMTFAPGYYEVSCELSVPSANLNVKRVTGFWVYDEAYLTTASPFSVNRDYFARDGKPYPIMGTTYMAGDTHRKFLLEPNPAVWERDFASMKEAGVNWIRTGVWTSWKRYMLDPGAMEEGVLRAFTAFLLTARKHDIPITFNFFAFWPEEWGGVNPYLDPRSLQAQSEFVAAFTQRFAKVPDLSWDFINEPSATSPERCWSMRPNYDAYERKAWQAWLQRREGDFSAEEAQAQDSADVWRERWRLSGNEALSLPALPDFQDMHIFQGTHPLRALDFKLFAQEVFANWTREMVKVVRANQNPQQLVTVGQDEGGIWDRPNTHFYASAVDFTANHTWWQNDDLLWDSVITKTPNKPNVSQETGVMFYEKADGGYWRSPENAARLLARKLAWSFAGGGAGAIQWLWNTNIYMDSDNEVGIGFHRADGTEKPELDSFRSIAQFVQENAERFQDRKLEEVCLVIPHSSVFMTRGFGDVATRRAVRTLETNMGVPVRAVSEYFIEDIGSPKLIILPAPNALRQACWERVLHCVAEGAILVVTGVIDRDEYLRPVPRIASLLESPLCTKGAGVPPVIVNVTGGHPEPELQKEATGRILTIAPVSRCERMKADVDGETHTAIFGGDKIQRLEKAVSTFEYEPKPLDTMTLSYGEGKILYCGLPLELSDTMDALQALYRRGCVEAQIATTDAQPDGVTISRVEFAETTLAIIVSESDEGAAFKFYLNGCYYWCEVTAGNTVLAFVHNDTWEVLSASPQGGLKRV